MSTSFKVMSLTDAAADRIKAIIADADRPIAGLRVGVKNGGCAGMSYTMEYAEDRKPGEDMVEDRGALCAEACAIAGDGRRHLPRVAGAQRDERLLLRTGKQFGLGIGIRGKDIEASHDVGLCQPCRGPDIEEHVGNRVVFGCPKVGRVL